MNSVFGPGGQDAHRMQREAGKRKRRPNPPPGGADPRQPEQGPAGAAAHPGRPAEKAEQGPSRPRTPPPPPLWRTAASCCGTWRPTACWPRAPPTPPPSTWAALRVWRPRSSRRCWGRTPYVGQPGAGPCAPPLRAGDGRGEGPQRPPDLGAGGHRPSLCPAGDRPPDGPPGGLLQRRQGRPGGPGPLPRPGRRTAVFAGSVRRP